MESELSPDKVLPTPPVPLKTYQWEDLRRARESGAYPWTHLLKPPLEGEVTAEDIIRETTPRRSMSRDVSRSRTHTPDYSGSRSDIQKILQLDSSPGSSRRHGDEGDDEGVQIPNFSKEVSLDSEEDVINQAVIMPGNQASLQAPLEIPKNVSPKSILKRRTPEPQFIPVMETREKTKCCHPLVNKIKHLADKTLQKLDKSDGDKSPLPKRKKNIDSQEIRQLRSSPGAVRRQKFSAIKLGDSDEMSKTMSIDTTPPARKKKEHIYEDIEENKGQSIEKCLQFTQDVYTADKGNNNNNNASVENDNLTENKSIASQDPSLITEDNCSDLRPEEHVMEKLHKMDDIEKEALVLDFDNEEPNIDEIFQNQLEEVEDKESPNITITEIIDEETEEITEEVILRQPSPSQSPGAETSNVDINYWSKPNSDHEYEVIEKPHPEIIYTAPSVEEKPVLQRKDDELSSTTSLERKYLQHTSDEDENLEGPNTDLKYEGTFDTEAIQRDIEDRYFVNTPSTVSRTECEISTSQVDSSALENLPLKRENRSKRNGENSDNKFQAKFREGTDKIKCQAGKIKTKFQSITAKSPEKSKTKFPKFSLPDRRKFSLPDRPKFKKINISEKLSLGDRKKFTFPERPKFNVPDLPKFKFPERPKVNFPSFSKKKEHKEDQDISESNTDLRQVATVDFETKTYPRLFKRKKKSDVKTSSSPTLDREETPIPIFTFARISKEYKPTPTYRTDSPAEPREYGNIEDTLHMQEQNNDKVCRYDFDKMVNDSNEAIEEYEDKINENQDTISAPDISTNNQEYTHVINEINNDEFFVRPRGISRENIQMREYLSDEIRQAFKIPKNALSLMSSKSEENEEPLYANGAEADPELYIDENEPIGYSNEDLNERDDGYYTFPPVRPNRAKRKKKEPEPVKYIDESYNTNMQFSDVDLGISEDKIDEQQVIEMDTASNQICVEEYNNNNNILAGDILEDVSFKYQDDIPIQSQTLPSAPKRKKRNSQKKHKNSSISDLNNFDQCKPYGIDPSIHEEDIIVYRTEHEYIVPGQDSVIAQQSPLPPRRSRNRSRSSHGTSLCDDDRTSQGASSLILDTQISPVEETELNRSIRHESPGYATVDKGGYSSNKVDRNSKTPPARRRKSHSSERKYYTVGPTKESAPERPIRKKSATSLMTLDSITKRSASGDITQYDEIDDPHFEEVQKDLKSGEVVSKMRDRPLPPPPRPPRNSTRKKSSKDSDTLVFQQEGNNFEIGQDPAVVEIEVSTQTDPLPDDVDYELGLEENIDFSMCSSLRDIADADSMSKSLNRLVESPRQSRPVSRSDKSIKLSDPKITELSKPNIGRTSPTVILVERRVSSPTRINEHEEMLTEASLTVQHIDVDESIIPEVPPLPRSRISTARSAPVSRDMVPASNDRALENVNEFGKEVQLDNLVTQRLQVKDLDVGRLNVSELQASKILVSDIEGMTLQVAELDSKSGHISVSGIEFSQTIIDEIVKKFAELRPPGASIVEPIIETQRPESRDEETQTEESQPVTTIEEPKPSTSAAMHDDPAPSPSKSTAEESNDPPQRPPPPDLTPLLYSYLQDLSMPPASFYHLRTPRDRPFTEFHESQQSPPPPRRAKRKPAPHNDSSSDDSRPRPSPRRMPPPVKVPEQTISEAGAQFIRVCHNSICDTVRNLFNSLMNYIGGTEDKKDLQMALVIFLVLIAGLIMFGLSDSRTIHHHHWEFFNPPDGKKQ